MYLRQNLVLGAHTKGLNVPARRNGDSMFATGVLGRFLGRLGNYYGGRRAGVGAFYNQAIFG